MSTMALGYIPQLSSPPDMCVYHGQFGFGDPVTDVVSKICIRRSNKIKRSTLSGNSHT